MFNSRTVILVGAGASAEFGIPTGMTVYKEALASENDYRAPQGSHFSFHSGFQHYLSRHYDQQLISSYGTFMQRVKSAVSPSIDRLAWLNEDVSEHCRAFSAWSIMRSYYVESFNQNLQYAEITTNITHKKKRNHLAPFVGPYQNWIAKCADKWLGIAQNSRDLRPERLSFITFNYDLLIEEAFANFVLSTRRFADIETSQMPEVIHVHGAFPKMPEVLAESDVYAAQKCIKYIEDGGDETAVQRAKEKLETASHIISVGFDFDEKNVALLSLGDFSHRLHVLNYDGNEALENRVLNHGVKEANIVRGTYDRPIGVSQAASRGLFDRPELIQRTNRFGR